MIRPPDALTHAPPAGTSGQTRLPGWADWVGGGPPLCALGALAPGWSALGIKRLRLRA